MSCKIYNLTSPDDPWENSITIPRDMNLPVIIEAIAYQECCDSPSDEKIPFNFTGHEITMDIFTHSESTEPVLVVSDVQWLKKATDKGVEAGVLDRLETVLLWSPMLDPMKTGVEYWHRIWGKDPGGQPYLLQRGPIKKDTK